MRTLPDKADMKRATYARDTSYDGIFYVCVTSTRIFCLPSCPARKPHPHHLIFHGTARECLLDGFRPCKRCRPLNANGGAPDWLDPLIARVEQAPSERITDDDLRSCGVSPYRARRYFQSHFGMTFQGYHRARRMGLALDLLRAGEDPLHVGYDTGFESSSGFRDAFARVFGATPGQNNDTSCIKTTRIETPLGPMVAGATGDGVCLLEFGDRRALERQVKTLRSRLRSAVVPGTNDHLKQLACEIGEYFEGRRTTFDVKLNLPGTPFQRGVWAALQKIAYGQTRSYDDVARAVGSPGAQRAVGRANGDNRIAIVVPCHRVVRRDGTLCGYGGGLWRKKYLLDLERTKAVPAE